MGKYLTVVLFLMLWAPALQAGEAGFAIRGISLGQPQEAARAQLWADNPHHQTRQDPVYAELERDLASSLWNLGACQPSRATLTRKACTRSEVHYSHPKLGAAVMFISFTQTLIPTVPAAEVEARLIAAYGPAGAEETLRRGLFRTTYGKTLSWTAEGGRQLQARLYFYDGEAARTIALTLQAEDPELMAENQALLAEIAAGGGPAGKGQLTF